MHSQNSSADGSVLVETLQRQLKVNILLLIPPRTLVLMMALV